MIRSRAIVLLAILTGVALTATNANATAPCPTKWTKDGFVALRKAPGANSILVKKLWYPTAVDIYPSGHTTKWLRVWVNGPNGLLAHKGYVRKSLIDLNSCG